MGKRRPAGNNIEIVVVFNCINGCINGFMTINQHGRIYIFNQMAMVNMENISNHNRTTSNLLDTYPTGASNPGIYFSFFSENCKWRKNFQ